mgnify:CR=1 FL=1
MDGIKALVDTIVEGIQEKKGKGITIIDLKEIEGAIARYFIICEGNSPIQVEAIAGEIGDRVRERLHEKPTGCVGLEQAVWVAIDFVDVMVHVFVPETRDFYDLEHLWEDAHTAYIPDLD